MIDRKYLLLAIVAMCAAVLAICAYVDPDSFVDSIDHSARTVVDVCLVVLLAYAGITYKD